MEHVRWTSHPSCTDRCSSPPSRVGTTRVTPASTAVRWLARRWDAEPFAHIDPEEFFDFSATRPRVHLDDGLQREIVWPGVELQRRHRARQRHRRGPAARHRAAAPLAHVLRAGDRAWPASWGCGCVITSARCSPTCPTPRPGVGHRHRATTPRSSSASASPSRATRVRPASSACCTTRCTEAGVASASLWAAVPELRALRARRPRPRSRSSSARPGCSTSTSSPTDLEIAAAGYERQVTELVADDDDTAAYVRHLEATQEEEQDVDPAGPRRRGRALPPRPARLLKSTGAGDDRARRVPAWP